ncbi:LamG domain-containing protein [Rhodococcus qingshengii]|uniref:LamG domain-containing protein n=1 Tax=Rhodococcus qingshengii TaxID=334542 RepID=UPI001ABFB449|nr:LamG domain-containing protein [Rhodococcus qingshengii]
MYQDVILADSPLVYFRCETNTAFDTVSGANKSLVGVPTVTSGKVGNGWTLNASQAIAMQSAFTDYSAGTFSVECWFKTGPATNDYPTLWRRDGGGKAILLRLRGNAVASPGKLEIYLNGVSQYSASRYDDNKWHHVVLAVGSGNARLYVDSVEIMSVAVGDLSIPNTGSRSHALASGSDLGSATEGWSGQIDEIAIYARKLSALQVSAHFGGAQPALTLVTGIALLTLSVWEPSLSVSASALSLRSGVAQLSLSALSASLSIQQVYTPISMTAYLPVNNLRAELGSKSIHARLVRKQYRTGEK